MIAVTCLHVPADPFGKFERFLSVDVNQNEYTFIIIYLYFYLSLITFIIIFYTAF